MNTLICIMEIMSGYQDTVMVIRRLAPIDAENKRLWEELGFVVY